MAACIPGSAIDDGDFADMGTRAGAIIFLRTRVQGRALERTSPEVERSEIPLQ